MALGDAERATNPRQRGMPEAALAGDEERCAGEKE